MPGAFQSVATATSIVACCPGRRAACAGPARASASDAAAIRRTRRLCPLEELLAVDERAAREPCPAGELPDLDVHRIGVVMRVLLAILTQPPCAGRPPTRPASASPRRPASRIYPPAAAYTARLPSRSTACAAARRASGTR